MCYRNHGGRKQQARTRKEKGTTYRVHCTWQFFDSLHVIGVRDSSVDFILSRCSNRSRELTEETLLPAYEQTVYLIRQHDNLRVTQISGDKWVTVQFLRPSDGFGYPGCQDHPSAANAVEYTAVCFVCRPCLVWNQSLANFLRQNIGWLGGECWAFIFVPGLLWEHFRQKPVRRISSADVWGV